MRPFAQYQTALRLIRTGLNDCAVARMLMIPRQTVREWRWNERRGRAHKPRPDTACPVCGTVALNAGEYAYLLGLYLGDGCLSEHRRQVFRLRVSLDARYPGIVDECTSAMRVVSSGHRVARQPAPGCIVVGCYWKHWPCLFPQHGPGQKHRRSIELQCWQSEIARAHPDRLLRGLVHSDGSRFVNRVAGRDYVRYQFTNNSPDIRAIFCQACEDVGVSWTQSFWKRISVARAPDVAKLDTIVGPKG